jgi:hypothetical protein
MNFRSNDLLRNFFRSNDIFCRSLIRSNNHFLKMCVCQDFPKLRRYIWQRYPYHVRQSSCKKSTESSHFQLQARSEMSLNPEKADPPMFSYIDVGPRAHRNCLKTHYPGGSLITRGKGLKNSYEIRT